MHGKWSSMWEGSYGLAKEVISRKSRKRENKALAGRGESRSEFKAWGNVADKPSSWQLSTRQPLAHPSPSPPAGWGEQMDKG